MKNIIWAAGSVVVSVFVAFLLFGSHGAKLGAISSPATNLDFLQLSQGLQIPAGPSISTALWGSQIQGMFRGKGILIMPNYTSLVASTSLVADIAVPGVVSGDAVLAQFATSTAAGAGWLVTGASASTTAGFITINFVNNTGAAATIPAGIASSTTFLVTR